MDGDNLGPTSAWQIRDFPTDLRRRITAAAADAEMTVTEYATRVFLTALDDPASLRSTNGHAAPSITDLRDLVQTAAAMQQASGQTMSKRSAHRLYGFVDDQVRAAAGLPARKVRQAPLQIAAPKS
jgi:hypothetical protein